MDSIAGYDTTGSFLRNVIEEVNSPNWRRHSFHRYVAGLGRLRFEENDDIVFTSRISNIMTAVITSSAASSVATHGDEDAECLDAECGVEVKVGDV